MRLVIDRVRLIDGTGRDPIDDAVLEVEDGVITFAGPRSSAPDASGAEVLEGEGATLIPGLIDAHVHLTADAAANFEASMRALTLDGAVSRAVTSARIALAAGITTVRDLGGKGDSVLRAIALLREDPVPACDVVAAGTWLTAPGGHCHYAARCVSSPADAAEAVREQHAIGARCIKVIATGGVLSAGMTATEQQLDDATLVSIVSTAHDLGMRVAAHAIGAPGIDASLRAGVDSIEHGCYAIDADRTRFLSNPTWLVPTFCAPDGIRRGVGVPDFAVAKAEEVTRSHIPSFVAAMADGVRIAAGTDAGTPFNPIGELWRELALMTSHGLPPMRALQAATSSAAALLGLGDRGTLEPGRRADAVMLGRDPLEDVAAYREVRAVVKDGLIVRR